MVADKIYAAHPGELTLVDLEYEINPVFCELDDFRPDSRSEPAVPAIEIEDALDVILNTGARIDDAWPQLNLGCQILLVDLAVSLKRDAIDDGILDDLHDERIADPAQIDVRKKPGREERLQRSVHKLIVPGVARLDQQIRANCFRFDPLDAFYSDISDCATTTHLGQRRTSNRRLTNCGLGPRDCNQE